MSWIPTIRAASGGSYHRLGTYEYNQRDVRGPMADILNDITTSRARSFSSEHRLRPLPRSQVRPDTPERHYRLQAFFTPLLPRDDLTLARSRQWTEYQAKREAWERAASASCARSTRSSGLIATRDGQPRTAKFPDDIKRS